MLSFCSTIFLYNNTHIQNKLTKNEYDNKQHPNHGTHQFQQHQTINCNCNLQWIAIMVQWHLTNTKRQMLQTKVAQHL